MIPYVPIVDPEHIWNDEDYVVNNLINTNSIAPVISPAPRAAISQAATAAQINSAMLQIFYQAAEAYAMRGGEISDGSSRSRQRVKSKAGNPILAA